MSQEDLLIHIFCLLDDLFKTLRPGRLRARGPTPLLADSEVVAIECFGELVGIDTDKGIYGFCRGWFAHLFPGLMAVNRTTFLRQAANLWGVKKLPRQRLADLFLARRGEPLEIIDSFPLAACRFARAPSCKRLAGVAAFGFDHTAGAVYYGLRVHLRCACGVAVKVEIAPANTNDRDLAPQMAAAGGRPQLLGAAAAGGPGRRGQGAAGPVHQEIA